MVRFNPTMVRHEPRRAPVSRLLGAPGVMSEAPHELVNVSTRTNTGIWVVFQHRLQGGAMSYAKQMLDTYPRSFNVDAGVLAATIDALNDCAQACTADADDDLSEQNVTEMVKCIRLCLDCAGVCTATVGVTSHQTEYDANVTKPLLEACAATCKSCADECERHAQMHAHCRVCAEACRRGEQASRQLLDAMK
jgi:hypothetical protein